MYDESLRPQFHFTARTGWLNDPNGLVFYGGQYHLFFQHNPFDAKWGNMTWGHAVSPDLVHWQQAENALHPDGLGTIFSGSAAVDWRNTTGFGRQGMPPLVAMYTSAGGTSPESEGQPFTQSLAFSVNAGESWEKYAGNPVLGHIVASNRDPRIRWHEPTDSWVMALYLDKNDYPIFTSPDLKTWTRTCDVTIPDASECPDLFPLPVDGDAGHVRWVFWAGNGSYIIGNFDGSTFTPEAGPFRLDSGANFYAAQTWSDIPAEDGRCIQKAWMQGGTYPDMPFNQQMSFPCELSLRTTQGGVRLCQMPVREIEKLREESIFHENLNLLPGKPFRVSDCELLDLEIEVEPGRAEAVELCLRGNVVRYTASSAKLSCCDREASLALCGGNLRLRVLLDRTSIEVFAGDGEVAFHQCFVPDASNQRVEIAAYGGEARIASLVLHRLRSDW
jgi:sucrose-6-phosphate hydrolase SacC (GH32 family)